MRSARSPAAGRCRRLGRAFEPVADHEEHVLDTRELYLGQPRLDFEWRACNTEPCGLKCGPISWRVHLGEYKFMRLEGSVAIITGAGSGQGRAAAVRFCSEGARVVVSDVDKAGAEETVAEIDKSVGAGHATGEKEETTIAANTMDFISEPLDARWLERVRQSTSAEPLLEPAYRQAPLSAGSWEKLRRHPQFA